MKTIEIFAEAVKFASEASEIPSYRILSESRDADVVDARMLCPLFRHIRERHQQAETSLRQSVVE